MDNFKRWSFNLDKDSYTKNFLDPDIGIDLAIEIANSHGYFEEPVRIPEGSSLTFKIADDYFLKITPPFFEDSIEAEIMAGKIIGNQLPFATPLLEHEGIIENWKYVISKAVTGVQAKSVYKKMDNSNKLIFAQEIGSAIRAIHDINSEGFERKFGPWEKYLSYRIQNQKSIHLEKGNNEEWAEKINSFILKYAEDLKKLGPAKMIHADLNHEHLILNQVDGVWHLSGIIDFADSMNAPIEMEFILPILCFFKGSSFHQKKMFESAKITPKCEDHQYSILMMALALQNRFIAFHDWFGKEIKSGAATIEEIAAVVFPT